MYALYHIHAKILPERVMIADLLYGYKSFAEEIDEQAYELKWNYCKENLKLI
jgi:hypothetical protein